MTQIALLDQPDWTIGKRMQFDALIPALNEVSEGAATYSDRPMCYWPVQNKKYPGVEFMLHPSLRDCDEVVLAEKSTGMVVSYGMNSVELLESASERLEMVTPEQMTKAIENGMRVREGKVTR